MSLVVVPMFALFLACGGGSEQPADGSPSTAAPVDGAAPAPAQADVAQYEKVAQALSVKDPEPHCQDMSGLVPDVVAAYRHIIANVKEPPLAPVRATTCLLSQHPVEAEVDALKWVADPEARSLTTIVLTRLDRMPLESALRIGAAALEGPHKEDAKLRISRSRVPQIKALAKEQ